MMHAIAPLLQGIAVFVILATIAKILWPQPYTAKRGAWAQWLGILAVVLAIIVCVWGLPDLSKVRW